MYLVLITHVCEVAVCFFLLEIKQVYFESLHSKSYDCKSFFKGHFHSCMRYNMFYML